MRCGRFAPLLAGLVLALGGSAHAQNPRPLPAAIPLRFESWRYPLDSSSKPTVPLVAAARNRQRQVLLGGAIGAAAGVVVCTAISTMINDSAERGLSFCPLDTYLLFGGAGFVLGAATGWLI
jgi:hypothetical protein